MLNNLFLFNGLVFLVLVFFSLLSILRSNLNKKDLEQVPQELTSSKIMRIV